MGIFSSINIGKNAGFFDESVYIPKKNIENPQLVQDRI